MFTNLYILYKKSFAKEGGKITELPHSKKTTTIYCLGEIKIKFKFSKAISTGSLP